MKINKKSPTGSGNLQPEKQWIEGCLRSSERKNINSTKGKNWEMKNTQAIKWNLLSGQNPFCTNPERWKENCVA
jgi:hypothetical protein